MAFHFNSEQYDQEFQPKRLGNWQNPKHYSKTAPRQLTGFTQVIANDRGHLLNGVPRSAACPWGHFVGTWDMPKKLPGNYIDIPTAREPLAQAKLLDERDKALAAMNRPIPTTRSGASSGRCAASAPCAPCEPCPTTPPCATAPAASCRGPCASTRAEPPSPCAGKLPSPCAGKPPSPCAGKPPSPCAGKSASPCAAKCASPCPETSPPCDGTVSQTQAECPMKCASARCENAA